MGLRLQLLLPRSLLLLMKNVIAPATALFGAAVLAVAPAVMAIGIGLSASTPARAEFDWKSFGEAVNDAAQDYNRDVQRQTDRTLDRQRNCTTTFSGNTANTYCY